MDENIDERELARAPMRAQILASINRLGSSAPPSTSTSAHKDRSRRHRSSRRRDSADRDRDRDRDRAEHTKNASDNTADDDSKLRPRKSKIRFKSQREKSAQDGEAEDRRRYRSREYDDDDNDGGGGRESVPEGAVESKDDCPHRRRRSRTRSTSPRDGRRHRSRRHDEPGHGSHRSHRSHTSHRHHRHHRSHRHRRHDDNAEPDDADADPPLNEDAAFLQSLFDAMADDEGAAFWEGVYGQPVHEYAEKASAPAMTDDEYAAYVRQHMWERSDEGRRHAAQKAADARRREKDEKDENEHARQKQKQKQQEQKQADAAYWAEVDRSLKRGQARRQRKQWQEQREAYSAAWTAWEKQPTVATIPWPGGVDKQDEEAYRQQVRSFFLGDDKPTDTGLQTRLRDERVRWHPDKMQQKLGGSVDAEAMRRITAIFQVVDKLWGEVKR